MMIRVLRIGVTVRSLGVECTGCTNTIAQNGVVVMHWVLIYHICNAMQWALHFRMEWIAMIQRPAVHVKDGISECGSGQNG